MLATGLPSAATVVEAFAVAGVDLLIVVGGVRSGDWDAIGLING